MSVINIRRDVSDKFYRKCLLTKGYKMPKLIAKIEGRGNGIKTVISNLDLIAKALSRPPTYCCKFFGIELGAQSTSDEKTNRYVITGAHDQEKMQATLDGFIDKFVLCASCKNPETDLAFSKDGFIDKACKACGHKGPVDMGHKLVTYMVKSHQDTGKKGKKDRRNKRNCAAENETPDHSDNNEGEVDDLTKQIQADAALLSIDDAESDDKFLEDTSPEAVARRQKELEMSDAVSKLLGNDADEELEDPLEEFAQKVTAQGESIDLAKVTEFAEECGIKEDKVCVVLVQVLWNEKILVDKQVKKFSPIFSKFLNSEKSQKSLLGGVERLVAELHPELLPRVSIILKDIYECDLVPEEVFLAWAEKPSKKYVEKAKSKQVREKADPFISWLRDASEEESDEDE